MKWMRIRCKKVQVKLEVLVEEKAKQKIEKRRYKWMEGDSAIVESG